MTHSSDDSGRRIDRRTTLRGLAVAGVSSTAFGVPTAAKSGKGNGNGQGKGSGNQPCDIVVPDDYGSIQGAVDAADEGDSICVNDGTYQEQVVVNKSVTLTSADGADPTIQPASSPETFDIPETGVEAEPMIFAFGGEKEGNDISGSGTIEFTLSGFTVDGDDTQPDARRKIGVFLRNVGGDISNNTVENLGVGGKQTIGILAYGESDLTIRDNEVSGYERGGIGANGDGGEHPSPSVDIRNNAVVGSTGLGEAWGPNGIQLGYGAEGKIVGNDVSDNRYSDEGPVASGILLFESDGVVVRDNTVENADIGLSCGSWGWFRASANGNKFINNDVTDAEFGALLEAVAEPYGGVLTQTDPEVSNNKVVDNDIIDDEDTDDPDGNVGIGIFVEDNEDNEDDPSAENNKLINNTIEGFETETKDEGSGNKIRPIDP